MKSKPKTIFETIVNILSEQDVYRRRDALFSDFADSQRRAFELGQERTRQQAQKAREAKAAQEASEEAEGNQKLDDLRFKEQNARNAVGKLTDIGRGMAVTKQFARGDFNKSFGLPPAEKPRMAQATKTSSQPTEPAVPTAEPTEPAVPTAEPVAPEPMTRRATRQVASNNPGRRLYENNRSKIIFETVNQILSEGKGDRRGAGRKRNVKKARQRIKSDMKGLARVEDEMSDISGVQDRFWTPERAGREEELEQSYGKIQDRIATAKRRIAKRS